MIFDLDDTLIVEQDFARASLVHAGALLEGADPAAVAELTARHARALWGNSPWYELCRSLGISSWEGLWATFEGGHPSLEGLREWAPDYRSATWRGALGELGIEDPELARQMESAFMERQGEGHTLAEGAEEVVRAAGARHRLALLTNGPADLQRLKLAESGLAGYFDVVVISGELGLGKPDPAVFAHALEQLHVGADEALMVGDSWERDILGARGSGLAALWLSAGRQVPESGHDELTSVTIVEALRGIVAHLD